MVKTIEQTLYHLQLQIEEYFEPGQIIKLGMEVNKLSSKEELLKFRDIMVRLGFQMVGVIQDGIGIKNELILHFQFKRPSKFFHIGQCLERALASIGISSVDFWEFQ